MLVILGCPSGSWHCLQCSPRGWLWVRLHGKNKARGLMLSRACCPPAPLCLAASAFLFSPDTLPTAPPFPAGLALPSIGRSFKALQDAFRAVASSGTWALSPADCPQAVWSKQRHLLSSCPLQAVLLVGAATLSGPPQSHPGVPS